MQFVPYGPDVPEELLHAHESGRVVFFCGAGVSAYAGLPMFKGLVDDVYDTLRDKPSANEQNLIDSGRFEDVLEKLEDRFPDGRKRVRSAICDRLKLYGDTELVTHKSLLELGRCRNGCVHIVTTNFDLLFEKAMALKGWVEKKYTAPLLPIPKNGKWDGVVHLHGAISEEGDDAILGDTVVTSSDFGLAYLVERWASRFVSELFRNYIVCFVGYSVDDAVMKYMIDALAADRKIRNIEYHAYAFAGFRGEEEGVERQKWENKNVTPILFDSRDNYKMLHDTLYKWASIYSDGRDCIISEYAMSSPSKSTKQDDFVRRVVWALSDSSGATARLFANWNPAPDLAWLDYIGEPMFSRKDLQTFGLDSCCFDSDKDLKFSLIDRPLSLSLVPFTSFSVDFDRVKYDVIMSAMASWVLRYLNDGRALLWTVNQLGVVHPSFSFLLRSRLQSIYELLASNDQDRIQRFKENSPDGIPDDGMRMLWRMFDQRRVLNLTQRVDAYGFIRRLKSEGASYAARDELRKLLEARVYIRKGITALDGTTPSKGINSVLCSVTLVAGSAIQTWLEGDAKVALAPYLIRLLCVFEDALDDFGEMRSELVSAGGEDNSFLGELPSVSEHWQNRLCADWSVLVFLLRDAWLTMLEKNPLAATGVAERWFSKPFLIYKRLALFAASVGGGVPAARWLTWLESDNTLWLWSPETLREVSRLLVLRGKDLEPHELEGLERVILAGCPRELQRDDLEPDQLEQCIARGIWLRLKKLEASGAALSEEGRRQLGVLSASHTELSIDEKHQREEFPQWFSGTGCPDFEEESRAFTLPSETDDIVAWITGCDDNDLRKHDVWRKVCSEYGQNALDAIRRCAFEGLGDYRILREAISVWSDEKYVDLWRGIFDALNAMPDTHYNHYVHSVSFFVYTVARHDGSFDTEVFDHCSRIISRVYSEYTYDKVSVSKAINHPSGIASRAFFEVFLRGDVNDGSGIDGASRVFLDHICNNNNRWLHPARLIVASQSVTLFRIDGQWTRDNVLPLFEWDNDELARWVWEGFLNSGRIYIPLMLEMKRQFIDEVTASNLGENRKYVEMLVFMAFEKVQGYADDDFRGAFLLVGSVGLEKIASYLSTIVAVVHDDRKEYAADRVVSIMTDVWPQRAQFRTVDISRGFVRLCMSLKDFFPRVLGSVRSWLMPIPSPIIDVRVYDVELSERFPREALDFFDAVTDRAQWERNELAKCLSCIEEKVPDLTADPKFIRLSNLVRLQDGGFDEP